MFKVRHQNLSESVGSLVYGRRRSHREDKRNSSQDASKDLAEARFTKVPVSCLCGAVVGRYICRCTDHTMPHHIMYAELQTEARELARRLNTAQVTQTHGI